MEKERPNSIKEELLTPESKNMENVAMVYAKVFAGPPWYEVSRGMGCGKFYGPDLPAGLPCPCGCGILTEAYPTKETTEYIKGELLKPLALGKTISNFGTESGFGWGYQLNGQDFAKYKYVKESSQKKVAEVVGISDFFYISEVGIVPELQGMGFGMKITLALANQAMLNNLPILMRTNADSPMVKIAKKLNMEQILGPTMKFQDPENIQRVIFLKLSDTLNKP